MKAKKGRIGIVPLICLLLGLLAAPAAAYDPYGTVSDFTVQNADGTPGMTFYDIYGGATTGRGDLNDQPLFYRDVVMNRDNLTHWSNLAFEILKNGGGETAFWDHDGRGFTGEFGDNGHYLDLIEQWGSGLKTARTFKELEFAARARVSDYFVHDGKREVGTSEIEGIPEWQDDVDERFILYTDAFTADNDIGQRYYNYFGLAFYDFKLSLLADEDLRYSTAADGFDTIEEAVQAGAPGVTYTMTPGADDGFVSGVINDSPQPLTTSQQIRSVDTTTISNTISGSESHSFESMFGAELGFGYDAPAPTGGAEWSFKIYTEFTKGQVYTSAYDKTTQNSHTTENSSTISLTLPPHTQSVLKQAEVTMDATVNYDSPVVVTYKVALYSLCGHKYWDGLWVHKNYKDSHFLAGFGKDNGSGANAVDNLANRIKYDPLFANYEETYGDGLDWDLIYFANPTSEAARVKASVDTLKSRKPMSVTGATLAYHYSGFQSEAHGIQPLYPLRYVTAGYPEFGMGYGTHVYVKNIPLSGSDASYTPFYGFDGRYGHWILLDANRNPVTNSPIASLAVDPVSGETILTAGTTSGVLYLKYVIDEDQYSFGTGGTFTTNAQLTSTAVVKLTVVPSAVTAPRPESPYERGTAATGGGWLTLDDGSSATITFNVSQVPKTENNPAYKGNLLLVNEGRWRLSGDVTLYVSRADVGRVYGIGRLERWDATLAKGKGGWASVSEQARFQLTFIDADAAGAADAKGTARPKDMIGVSIDVPVPADGPALPNTDLVELKGGNIDAKR